MQPNKVDYSEAIWVNNTMVIGCSSCDGAKVGCPDAYSDLSHLCGAFDCTPMLGGTIVKT